MIVTIDGPAGSGKSTVARLLASELGIAYLDTGAMYRAIALRALRASADLDDPEELTKIAAEAELHLECDNEGVRVRLDGEDVTEAIRTMEVNQTSSLVARVEGVRDVLVRQQQRIGKRLGSLVAEGRDQGSVVFPDADVKFVLEADLDTRARRRYDEMTYGKQDVSIDEVRKNLAERDDRDAKRWEPLLSSDETIVLDTTDMGIEEVVRHMAEEVQRRVSS